MAFWPGSTPCLASDAAQDGQGEHRVKEIQSDSPQLVLKPRRNSPCTATAIQVPWVLFILRYVESCKVICWSSPCMPGVCGHIGASTFVTWKVELQNISVSQVNNFGWDFPTVWKCCQHLSAVVGQWEKVLQHQGDSIEEIHKQHMV